MTFYTTRCFRIRTRTKVFEFHSFYFHKLLVRTPILNVFVFKLGEFLFKVSKFFLKMAFFVSASQHVGFILLDSFSKHSVDRDALEEFKKRTLHNDFLNGYDRNRVGDLFLDEEHPDYPTFPEWKGVKSSRDFR